MQTVPTKDMFLIRCPAADVAIGTEIADAHKAYLESLGDALNIGAHAPAPGPSDRPERVFVLMAADADAATAMIQADPYSRAGGYAAILVTPLKVLIGSAIGGKAWP